MYQPETEDMLPRSAPKPSVPLDINTAAIVRPSVPEVSILFGAQQGGANSLPTTTATTQQPQQTYAAWKKQVLPKVTFPPAGSEVYSINGHVVSSASMTAATSTQSINYPTAMCSTQVTSNLYPLRPITANVPPIATTVSPFVNEPPTQMQQYRRSLEQPLYVQQNTQENMQRRSIGECTVLAHTYVPNKSDVLTICAGTQTDANLLMNSPTKINTTHLATKEEYQHVVALLGEMRVEQMHLLEAVRTLLAQQHLDSPQKIAPHQNASTQYNDADYRVHYEKQDDRLPHVEYEGMEEHNRLSTAHDRYHHYLESPRQPAAQSTAYQPHTPRTTNLPIRAQVVNNKPNTEKSMLMNELAMKYLPNEQLNELLQELNISPAITQKTATPLQPIENVERRPSDISNASYKYLKKYRLLPEEQISAKEQLAPADSQVAQVARQQQQQEQSPYQRAASPRLLPPQQAPMLDLENIRRQPKLI